MSMTIQQCEAHVGRSVTYRAKYPSAVPEHGVIKSTRREFAFVSFNNGPPIATRPEDLTPRLTR